MDESEQAHHELERLQGIIARHEGHIFVLRGWLLTVVGGLLAAYYTDNIQMNATVVRVALPGVAFLFLAVESRHANVVEAVVERADALERRIVEVRAAAHPGGLPAHGWYDGPRVSEACRTGANRWWPRRGMTFVLNQAFYLVVLLIVAFAMVALPPRGAAAARDASAPTAAR